MTSIKSKQEIYIQFKINHLTDAQEPLKNDTFDKYISNSFLIAIK